MRGLVLLSLTVFLYVLITKADTKNVVCYYGSWAGGRPGNGKFTVDDIDPQLCTHLIYTFVGLNDADGTINIMAPELDINQENFKRFNALKLKNKSLKTLVAIGGWNEGSPKYSRVAADPAKRATLIKSALNLVQTYGFDGFDIDWEYPNQNGGVFADKANYVKLIQEFRNEWNKHGLILTAAVAASSWGVDQSYDVPSLSKYLDYINVMAYDLHGTWDSPLVTGQNAPLYASSKDASKLVNVDAVIQGWISRGADPQKLNLGLGIYGKTYKLSNPSNHGLGAPATGGGSPGPYTDSAGSWGYLEICEMKKNGQLTVVWDDEQQVPYGYTKDGQWVGYDNEKSITLKVDYAKKLNLAGVMIWSIETEDPKGFCGAKYPLLNAIHVALGNGESSNDPQQPDDPEQPDEPQQPDEPEQPEQPEEPTKPSDKVCHQAGYVRDPSDCAVFIYCQPFNGDFVQFPQRCQNDLVYNTETGGCDYPRNVKC